VAFVIRLLEGVLEAVVLASRPWPVMSLALTVSLVTSLTATIVKSIIRCVDADVVGLILYIFTLCH